VPGRSGPVCVNLSTGGRDVPPAARELWDGLRSGDLGPIDLGPTELGHMLLPQSLVDRPAADGLWPLVQLSEHTGLVRVLAATPDWEEDAPLADGKPVLAGARLRRALLQGLTLSALVRLRSGRLSLCIFRGPRTTLVTSFDHPEGLDFALSADGRLLARPLRSSQVEVRDVLAGGPPQCVTPAGQFHSRVTLELGHGWLALGIGELTHLVRWEGGSLSAACGSGPLRTLAGVEALAALKSGRAMAMASQVPEWLKASGGRFRAAAWVPGLIAAVDRFGQVAVFRPGGTLVCMFFAFRRDLAAWAPDGTAWGAEPLLGRPATPGAAPKIARLLHEAEQAGGGPPA
jgi:hypothetical protein